MAQLKGQISKNFLSPPPPGRRKLLQSLRCAVMRVKPKKKLKKELKLGENMIFWRGGGKDFKTKYTPQGQAL